MTNWRHQLDQAQHLREIAEELYEKRERFERRLDALMAGFVIAAGTIGIIAVLVWS